MYDETILRTRTCTSLINLLGCANIFLEALIRDERYDKSTSKGIKSLIKKINKAQIDKKDADCARINKKFRLD